MLSIISLVVIPSIPKAVSCFPQHTVFHNTYRTKDKSSSIITVEFVIYFLCLASNI